MKILFYAFFLIITSYIMIKFYLNNSAFDIKKKKKQLCSLNKLKRNELIIKMKVWLNKCIFFS